MKEQNLSRGRTRTLCTVVELIRCCVKMKRNDGETAGFDDKSVAGRIKCNIIIVDRDYVILVLSVVLLLYSIYNSYHYHGYYYCCYCYFSCWLCTRPTWQRRRRRVSHDDGRSPGLCQCFSKCFPRLIIILPVPCHFLFKHSPTQFCDRRRYRRQSFVLLISVRPSESLLFFYLG